MGADDWPSAPQQEAAQRGVEGEEKDQEGEVEAVSELERTHVGSLRCRQGLVFFYNMFKKVDYSPECPPVFPVVTSAVESRAKKGGGNPKKRCTVGGREAASLR